MTNEEWIAHWFEAVTSGASTMSQRNLKAIDAHGGLDAVVLEAKRRGIHLLRVEDDRGEVLLAASLKPFEVLC